MAKGIVITLGIVVLAGILIVGITLLTKNQLSHDNIMHFIAENQLILNLDTSMEKSIRLIFNENSNLNISSEKEYIEFTESYPYINKLLPFADKINELLIIENLPWITVNLTSFTTIPIEFQDNSIYTHEIQGNYLTINKIDNIDLDIKLTGELTGCNYNLEPGTFKFKMKAEADNGTCYIDEFIDSYSNNKLDIITTTSTANLYLENRRFYIGNSSMTYKLRIYTNDTNLFFKDAYIINKGGLYHSGSVKIS